MNVMCFIITLVVVTIIAVCVAVAFVTVAAAIVVIFPRGDTGGQDDAGDTGSNTISVVIQRAALHILHAALEIQHVALEFPVAITVVIVAVIAVITVVITVFVLDSINDEMLWICILAPARLPLSSAEVAELLFTATSVTSQHITHAKTHQHSRDVVATAFKLYHVLALRARLPFFLLCNTHKHLCTFFFWAQAFVTIALADDAGLSMTFSACSHSSLDRILWNPLGTRSTAAVDFVPSIMFFFFGQEAIAELRRQPIQGRQERYRFRATARRKQSRIG
jgi:hypothetical protein